MTQIDTIAINNTENINAVSVIFICIFAGFLLYMLISASEDKYMQSRMKKAKRLIEEGHKKAVRGKKNDGMYTETKRERTAEEKEQWNKKIRESVAQDIRQLS